MVHSATAALTAVLLAGSISCAPTPEYEGAAEAATPVVADAGQAGDPTAELEAKLNRLLRTLEHEHEGIFGVAVATADGIAQAGDPGRWHAWSTIKVPIALAVLNSGAGEEEELRELVEASLTRSDNDAAAELWQLLGGGEEAARTLEKLLAPYGGINAQPLAADYAPTPIGLLAWPLAGQAEFASHLPCLPGAEPVYRAMGEIVPWQQDGLSLIEGAHFKGGWSRERAEGARPYTYRQLGVVAAGDGVIGLAVLVHPEDGTHATAVEMIDALSVGMGKLLVAEQPAPSPTCPSA